MSARTTPFDAAEPTVPDGTLTVEPAPADPADAPERGPFARYLAGEQPGWAGWYYDQAGACTPVQGLFATEDAATIAAAQDSEGVGPEYRLCDAGGIVTWQGSLTELRGLVDRQITELLFFAASKLGPGEIARLPPGPAAVIRVRASAERKWTRALLRAWRELAFEQGDEAPSLARILDIARERLGERPDEAFARAFCARSGLGLSPA